MTKVVHRPVLIAWIALVILTVISWMVGTEYRPADEAIPLAGVAILAVAAFKVRLVGLYFMELKQAPLLLRNVFEVYCALAFVVLAGVYAIG